MVLKEERTVRTLKFSSVVKGALAALALTVLGSAITGAAYQLTSVAESTLPATSTALFYFSIMAGSFIAARDAGARGLLHGVAVALLFLLVGLFISSLLFDAKVAPGSLLLKGGLSGVVGAVGGVLGVWLSR